MGLCRSGFNTCSPHRRYCALEKYVIPSSADIAKTKIKNPNQTLQHGSLAISICALKQTNDKNNNTKITNNNETNKNNTNGGVNAVAGSAAAAAESAAAAAAEAATAADPAAGAAAAATTAAADPADDAAAADADGASSLKRSKDRKAKQRSIKKTFE